MFALITHKIASHKMPNLSFMYHQNEWGENKTKVKKKKVVKKVFLIPFYSLMAEWCLIDLSSDKSISTFFVCFTLYQVYWVLFYFSMTINSTCGLFCKRRTRRTKVIWHINISFLLYFSRLYHVDIISCSSCQTVTSSFGQF